MAFNNPSSKLTFSVTGTGSTTGVYRFFGANVAPAAGGGAAVTGGGASHNGRIAYVAIREDAGGGATACDFKLVDQDLAVSDGMSYTVDELNIVVSGTIPTLTASATTASLSTAIDARPTYQSSLALILNVTAVGAWTIRGYVTVER